MPQVVPYNDVYLTATGAFLPGPAVDNDTLADYVRPVGGASERIRRRILAQNGIRTRHYAIDRRGRTRHSVAEMAAAAVRQCLGKSNGTPVDLLMAASSGGDLTLPGLACQIQAELGWRALTTASHHGVCAAGMQAVANAARALERGEHDSAMVVASELPSRLFKHSRFEQRKVDFNAHFLRWMLSDGAGAWRLTRAPAASGLSLKLRWVHAISHSGDYPLCMQMGASADGRQSWLDYPDFAAAEADGALSLRQDIRLLPHLFDIGTHEYVALVRDGLLDPDRIDHFLCHYSSEQFRPVVADCLERCGLVIDQARWYSNLAWRGNTGSASIFIMLDDLLADRALEAGEQILLFVPESGRFTVSFALLEVVGPQHSPEPRPGPTGIGLFEARAAALDDPELPPPHDPEASTLVGRAPLARLIAELAGVWHDYRARAWHTPMVRRILAGQFSQGDYLAWMAQWIPQVREGSGWMRTAQAGLSPRYRRLAELIAIHASDEQDDYRILFDDYRRAGGPLATIDQLRRNPGGEALHAWLSATANRRDAVGLLGAMYIIEGTGQRIIPALLPLLRRQLPGLRGCFRFLHYHGENDVEHLQRWLDAVESVLAAAEQPALVAADIITCARRTAELYLMQMHDILEAA
ncbi:MAG: iron-containing redox enzyme family protein [Wenzhouxiangella sp.]|nr:iron-containing redox enzyme family protein [Wenzhouxiangella sp.]